MTRARTTVEPSRGIEAGEAAMEPQGALKLSMRTSETLFDACACAGVDLEERCRRGSIWLFGSRAAACARSNSDWDLLVVLTTPPTGRGRERVATIDLVTVTTHGSARDRWLGSELAAHVACYGELLAGRDDWSDAILPSHASRRKSERTCARIASVSRAWAELRPNHRTKWALALRRDIQRSLALARIGTVPPTYVLDQEWAATSRRERERTVACIEPTAATDLRRTIVRADAPASGS